MKVLFGIMLWQLLALSNLMAKVDFYELTQGQCWLKKETTRFWKVATFSNKKALQVSLHDFEDQTRTQLEERLGAQSLAVDEKFEFTLTFHCTEVGPHFVLAIPNIKGQAICAKVKVVSGQLSIEKLYSNPLRQKGLCNFTTPGKIVLGSQNPEQTLKQLQQTDLIHDVEAYQIKRSALELTLVEKWQFREQAFRQRLLKTPSLSDELKWTEFETLYQVVGDAIRMLQGQL